MTRKPDGSLDFEVHDGDPEYREIPLSEIAKAAEIDPLKLT